MKTLMRDKFLDGIPKGHRDELVRAFDNIIKNFREKRWEPSELNGGKFCEVVYSILDGHTSGKFNAKPKKPSNMVDACRKLEHSDNIKFCRSVRILIPRMLMALYEIRNNRGVGHVGGDIDPNHMDALAILSMTKWILAELVRVFHSTDIISATQIVETLIERTIPSIWLVDGKRRILVPGLSFKDQMLLNLYHSGKKVEESQLVADLEHSNPSVFRRDVIIPAHKKRLIEYNKKEKTLELSPTGIDYVEKTLPLEISAAG